MRFSGEVAHKIASGQLTAVIRPLSRPPPANRHKKAVSIRSHRKVNKATDPEYLWKRELVAEEHGHAFISSERKRLCDLTAEDVAAAGHVSIRLFRSWFTQNVGKWKDGREVWLIRFTVDHDRPHWLTTPVWGISGDYADSYDPKHSPDELEVVNAAVSLHGPQSRARRQLDRRMLSTEERMRQARATARRHGIDIVRQEARLMDALKKGDQGKTIASIESLERKVESKAA